MTLLILAVLAGALSAWLSHRRMALYHDGLRPLVRGSIARETVAKLCRPVLLPFSLPVSIATGVPLVHLLLLGTDWIGLAVTGALAAAGAGAIYGAAVAGLIYAVQGWLMATPAAQTALGALGTAAALGFPLIPGLALWRMNRKPAGVLLLAGSACAAVGTAAGLVPASWHLPALAALAGLAVILAYALAVPPLAVAIHQSAPRRTAAAAVVIAINGALLAGLAQRSALAGDPLASALLAGGEDRLGLLVHSLVRTVSFLPTVLANYAVGGATATAGIPDWLLGTGSMMPGLVSALLAGAAVLTLEMALIDRVTRFALRRPGISTAASQLRSAVSVVTEVALIGGAVVGAQALWPVGGPVLLGSTALASTWRRWPRLPLTLAGMALLMLVARLP